MKVKLNSKILKIKDCKGVKSIRGLMFSDMKEIDGALIYANNIWMPFVKHSLDLLFLDENYKIIDIQKAAPITRKRKSWKTYKNKNAKYCLEIKSGLTKPKINTTVKFL